jgi:glycosyltransferase involved in cell wall biosynthesis
MRIALLAPPFIPVPPYAYGGTELFVAHLAEALVRRGHEVVVYANGQSRVKCEVRWTYAEAEWPPTPGANTSLKNLDHTAWAMSDAVSGDFDVVHINDAVAVPLSHFLSVPVVHTLHHPHEADLSAVYARYPDVTYIAISEAQRRLESMPKMRTIHHGIRADAYRYREHKEGYLAFLGRIAPMKGVHVAIDVARRAQRRLKISGEIQPTFHDYWETMVRPQLDGTLVEYVGEADHAMKNDLLAGASALLFPILWNEPFGLVMIEAMACGTPVLALPGGSVPEVVRDGVNGWICRDVEDMARRAASPDVAPRSCRADAERRFSVDRMASDYERAYREAATSSLAAVGNRKTPRQA